MESAIFCLSQRHNVDYHKQQCLCEQRHSATSGWWQN